MTVRLLCVGDMHLGRSPGGLGGERLGLLDLDARQLGPRAAWERTVEHALEEAVDALLLAGDVVDAEDDFFEAYDALKRGVETLVDAGIAVLGVAGNHDVKVLPELAKHVADFRLLGRGGRWERAVIAGHRNLPLG
jgi:DNA repair protein SbcD/Mre11